MPNPTPVIDWQKRLDIIQTLRSQLSDLLTKARDLETNFPKLEESTDERVRQYSENVGVVAEYFRKNYFFLYSQEEYDSAYISLYGVEKDVQQMVIDGLNVNADSIVVAEDGAWAANIYLLLASIPDMSIEMINQILSYIQYGLKTWESARKLTFPEPVPGLDDIPDPLRTPKKNLLSDWGSVRGSFIAHLRGIVLLEENRKAVYLCSTIGRGATTSVRELICPDPGDYGIGDMIDIYDPVTDSWTSTTADVMYVFPVLCEGAANIPEYASVIIIDRTGNFFVRNRTMTQGAKIRLMNHVSYPFCRKTGTPDIAPVSLAGDSVSFNISSSSFDSCLSIWQKYNDATPSRSPLNYAAERRSFVMQVPESGLDRVMPGASVFYLATYTLIQPSQETPSVEGVAVSKTATGTFDSSFSYRIALELGNEYPTVQTVSVCFEGTVTVTQGGRIGAASAVVLYDLPEETKNLIAEFNFADSSLPLCFFKGCRLTLNTTDKKIYIESTTGEAVDILMGDVIHIRIYHTPQITVNFTGSSMGKETNLVRMTVTEEWLSSANAESVRYFGIRNHYGLDPDAAMGMWTMENGDLCRGQLLSPRPGQKPVFTQPATGYTVNIYQTDAMLLIYEFVVTGSLALWDGTRLLLSASAMPKVYYPGHHLTVQLGLNSYITWFAEGGAAVTCTKKDMAHLSPGLRFCTWCPSISMLKVRSGEQPSSGTNIPRVSPTRTLTLPGYDPKTEDLYYYWNNISVSQLVPVKDGNVSNLPMAGHKYSLATQKGNIVRNEKDGASARKETPVDSPDTLQVMITDLLKPKVNGKSIHMLLSDGTVLRAVSIKQEYAPPTPETQDTQVLTGCTMVFVIAGFPWAESLLKAFSTDIERMHLQLDKLNVDFGASSQLDFFDSIRKFRDQFSAHTTAVSDLSKRLTDSATFGKRSDLPTLQQLKDKVYSVWDRFKLS